MNKPLRALALTCIVLLPAIAFAQASIDAILSSTDRPDADRARDAASQPANVLAFFDIGAGDRVADLLAGGGYYTRILVPLVGPTGQVYSGNNPFFRNFFGEAFDALLAEPAFAAVVRVDGPVDALTLPRDASLDAVIVSQSYHDLVLGDEDRGAMNRTVFAALKPGGVYGIIDHAAAPASGISTTESLHRIDKQFLITEIEAAGFRLASEADYLSNPNDDHAVGIFDPSVRGQTDRFVLRFEKPR
jgi:predicted methyltransferase